MVRNRRELAVRVTPMLALTAILVGIAGQVWFNGVVAALVPILAVVLLVLAVGLYSHRHGL